MCRSGEVSLRKMPITPCRTDRKHQECRGLLSHSCLHTAEGMGCVRQELGLHLHGYRVMCLGKGGMP